MKRKPSPHVRVRYSAPSGSRKVCSAKCLDRVPRCSGGEEGHAFSAHDVSRQQGAPGAVASQDSRESALVDFHNNMHAQSALGSRALLLNSRVRFHHLWFGSEVQPFPVTTFKIFAVGAMLKAGGYRSGPNFLSRAKEQHVVLGFLWTDELRLAVQKTSSSITRGIGRPRPSQPVDLSAGIPWLPGSNSHPVGGELLIIEGGFFCTREIELSLALRQHISVDLDILRVTWHLPSSKTDPRASGKIPSRFWTMCESPGNPRHLCPCFRTSKVWCIETNTPRDVSVSTRAHLSGPDSSADIR